MRGVPKAILAVSLLSACTTDREASVALVTGEETEVFTRAPAPTSMVVESIDLEGKVTELSRRAAPFGELDLGDHSESDVAALRIRAFDPTNKLVVAGESLYFQYGALAEGTLDIFVQRTGELARMPSAPAATFEAPLADVLLGRYVLLVKGTAVSLYDLLGLRALQTPPVFKRTAASVTSSGSTALVIDGQGASSFDLSTGQEIDVAAPEGGNYGEVAGGLTVRAKDGTSFVVGATRDGAPSGRILRLSKDGKLSFASLVHPRSGACATWIEGRGLVVYGGGTATDPAAEALVDNATTAAPLALPPDAVKGCGIAGLDGGKIVVAGGKGAAGDMGMGLPARAFDLACGSNCTAASFQGVVPLVRAQATTVAGDAALFVGDDASGATKVFRASPGELREIPLKIARRGARLLPLPTNAVGIVGGAAVVESYRE